MPHTANPAPAMNPTQTRGNRICQKIIWLVLEADPPNRLDAEIDSMTSWVVDRLGVDVPMHFTAFHPDFKMRDRPPTPPATLTRARRIAISNGVRFAYTGNVHDGDGGTTTCPSCGLVLVRRDWYVLSEYRLTDDGRCGRCGESLPGVFDGPVGDWGAKRLPVRLAEAAP